MNGAMNPAVVSTPRWKATRETVLQAEIGMTDADPKVCI